MRITAYIPSRDAAAHLPAAIAALRAQTIRPDELLVIDDGSADETASTAEALGARVIRHQRSLGRGAARARALVEARGEFVIGLDATSTIEPEFLRTALEILERERLDGVCARVMGPAPGNAVERWRARHLFKEGTPRTAMDALITTCSLLRREAVLAAGNFDARLAEGEDRELGQRMASAGYRVVLHPALHVISHKREKLFAMLARYRRWNHAAEVEIGWKEYARLCGYAVKSMVPADLRAGDPGAAAISLLCPHYQFWMSQDVNRPAAERACNATLELSKP